MERKTIEQLDDEHATLRADSDEEDTPSPDTEESLDIAILKHVRSVLAAVENNKPETQAPCDGPFAFLQRIENFAKKIEHIEDHELLGSLKSLICATHINREVEQQIERERRNQNSPGIVDEFLERSKDNFHGSRAIGSACEIICAIHPGILVMLEVLGYDEDKLRGFTKEESKSALEDITTNHGEQLVMLCKLGRELREVIEGRKPSEEMIKLGRGKLNILNVDSEIAYYLLQPWYRAEGCGCPQN